MRRGESHLCSAASLSHNFSSTQARLPSHSHVTCVQIFSSMPHHRDRHYDLLPLSFDGPKKRGCARPAAVAQPHLVCLLLPACCCCCVQAHLVASPFCASGARAQIVDAKRSGRRQRATIIIFQRPDAKVRQPTAHARRLRMPAARAWPCLTSIRPLCRFTPCYIDKFSTTNHGFYCSWARQQTKVRPPAALAAAHLACLCCCCVQAHLVASTAMRAAAQRSQRTFACIYRRIL